MKVDFHFHLEEGPYTIDWLKRTAQALSNFSDEAGTLKGIMELTNRLQERVVDGGFDEKWLSLYAQQGQMKGISHYGIVDHPYRFSEFRSYYEQNMVLDDSPIGIMQSKWLDYISVGSIEPYLRVIQKAQQSGYPISLGIEADYFPGGEDQLAELLSNYEFDYIMGAVHCLDGQDFYNPAMYKQYKTQDLPELYEQHFVNVQRAAASGLFDMIAHLDNFKVCNQIPDELILLPMYVETAKALKKADVATELNTGLAYRYPVKEMCPSPAFLNILFQHGVPITLGSDAHYPDDLGTMLNEAVDLLSAAGYREIVYFKQRQRISLPL